MVDKSSLPKGASSVVDMRDFQGDGQLTLIHGYGGGGFRIAKQPYQGDQILLPRTRFDWQAPAWDKITIDDLTPIFSDPLPPLLIMGLGQAPQGLLPEFPAFCTNFIFCQLADAPGIRVTAVDRHNHPMALEHENGRMHAVQFHPEEMGPGGRCVIQNMMRLASSYGIKVDQ